AARCTPTRQVDHPSARRPPPPKCFALDGFAGDRDAPLQHHLPDLPEAEREPVIQPGTVADDLHRKPETLVRRHTGAARRSPPRPSTQTIRRSSQPPPKLTVPYRRRQKTQQPQQNQHRRVS